MKLNPRKDPVQQNISLWQALAANGLCEPGTYGEHAKKLLMAQTEDKKDDGENPFEDDDGEILFDCPVKKEFAEVKKAVEQALYWRDIDDWELALEKSIALNAQLKPRLDQGESEMQELNRNQVVPLAILCTNMVFKCADKPADQRDVASKVAQALLGSLPKHTIAMSKAKRSKKYDPKTLGMPQQTEIVDQYPMTSHEEKLRGPYIEK